MTPPLRIGNFFSSLRGWDESCLEKHLGAIARSIATPEELNDFVLMKDETPLHFLRLAGISDAPGLHDDVAQRCRMTFTNKGRLIYTQVDLISLPKICNGRGNKMMFWVRHSRYSAES